MDFKARRKLSENHGCSHCDLGDAMVAEIERLRTLVKRATVAWENGDEDGCIVACMDIANAAALHDEQELNEK